jgi:methylenetetrahydrofolate dehydrogenase (NADP+)/methenyltetrahydrofolate cyclohydrolase
MTAEKLDGQAIAQRLRDELREEIDALARVGVRPGLAAVLDSTNPGSQLYVSSKIKACGDLGIYSEKHALAPDATTDDLLRLVEELNARDEIDGILLQLPLPRTVDTERVLSAVDPSKDVDGLHPINVARLLRNQETFEPCTPAGIIELLTRYNIPIEGQRAVVIGRSEIVGKPMALMLLHRHATVTICHSRTRHLPAVCREADILVAAIGRAALVTGDYIKPGAVVIDVGQNKITDRGQVDRLFGGDEKKLAQFDARGFVLVGDVHPLEGAKMAGYLTPVPGGVGPLTIVMLMKNTVKAARLRRASATAPSD